MKRALLILLACATAGIAQVIETNLETGVILLPLKDAATHEMLRASLRDKDPLVRIQGIVALQIIRDPADLPLLRQLTNDPVAAVREQAQPRPPTPPRPAIELPATPAQIRQALQSPDLLQQEVAIDAIARLKLPDLSAEILPHLDRPDSILRRHVCETLGALRVEHSTPLAEQLARDDDPFVRRAAAEAILAIHTATGRDALLHLLTHNSAPVRLEAVRALGGWKDTALAPAIHPLLTDKDAAVARHAGEALGKLRNPESIRPLIDALTTRKDLALDHIAWALGELAAPEAVPALLATVTGASDPTQTAACEALGKIGNKDAIPVLRKVLVDMRAHNSGTRQHAIDALVRLGDRDSTKRVIQIITERVVPPPPGMSPPEPNYDSDDARAAGVRYLGFIGDPKLIADMFAKLKDLPSYSLRLVMAEVTTHVTGKPHMAEFSYSTRTYLMESLALDTLSRSPDLPGVVPIP